MACIFLSAGEASGEQYGVQLMQALRDALTGEAGSAHTVPRFVGLGGTRMQAAGLHRIVRAEDVAVMGITEILRHIPRIYREYRKLRKALATEKPDVVVLIDFPDVNLGLARRAKRLGIPVVFFVSPQVWAWKKHRLRQIQRNVDRMLVIFPFEEAWYRERGVAATFVGHPLAEMAAPTLEREAFARLHGLDAGREWVGVLPGSRPGEIALNLPTMLAAAALLGNGYDFLLPLAPTLTHEQIDRVRGMLAQHSAGLTIKLVPHAREALQHARASMVASGTATVEAALIGNPFVVVYRLSGLSYAVAKRVVRVPHVAMVNLIAGRRVVPELIQSEFTAQSVMKAMEPLMADTPARAAMMDSLQQVKRELHPDASVILTVAAHVLAFLPEHQQPERVTSYLPVSAAL